MRAEWNAVRATGVRLQREECTDDLHLVEHRCGEDVQARAVREQQLGDVTAAHVRGRSERGLPVAVAPIPGGVRERGVLLERLAHRVEIAVRVPDELLDGAHDVASRMSAASSSFPRAIASASAVYVPSSPTCGSAPWASRTLATPSAPANEHVPNYTGSVN